jgi:ferredoxin
MTSTLRVDPIACAGHGLCAELLPERVALDDWGYPIVDPAPVSGELEQHARRAVDACPKLALLLARTSADAARARSSNGDATSRTGRAGTPPLDGRGRGT